MTPSPFRLRPRRLFEDRLFFGVATLVLGLTALAKLATVPFSTTLNKADPVFPFLSQQHLLLDVALLEVLVVVLCRSRIATPWKHAAVTALATGFLCYRLGLSVVGVGHCACLGTLPKNALVEGLLWLSVGYLVAGGLRGLLRHPPGPAIPRARPASTPAPTPALPRA